jgi:transcriptional regulator with XRE-family HTH domain
MIKKIETLEQLLRVGDSVRDFFAYIYNSRGITRDDLLGKLGWTNNALATRLKGGSIKETDIEHIARALNLTDNELLAFINFL